MVKVGDVVSYKNEEAQIITLGTVEEIAHDERFAKIRWVNGTKSYFQHDNGVWRAAGDDVMVTIQVRTVFDL